MGRESTVYEYGGKSENSCECRHSPLRPLGATCRLCASLVKLKLCACMKVRYARPVHLEEECANSVALRGGGMNNAHWYHGIWYGQAVSCPSLRPGV